MEIKFKKNVTDVFKKRVSSLVEILGSIEKIFEDNVIITDDGDIIELDTFKTENGVGVTITCNESKDDDEVSFDWCLDIFRTPNSKRLFGG